MPRCPAQPGPGPRQVRPPHCRLQVQHACVGHQKPNILHNWPHVVANGACSGRKLCIHLAASTDRGAQAYMSRRLMKALIVPGQEAIAACARALAKPGWHPQIHTLQTSPSHPCRRCWRAASGSGAEASDPCRGGRGPCRDSVHHPTGQCAQHNAPWEWRQQRPPTHSEPCWRPGAGPALPGCQDRSRIQNSPCRWSRRGPPAVK